MTQDVVVLSAVRSAIGSYSGALSSIEPSELAGTVMQVAVERSGVDPHAINYVTVGNCIPTEARYPYVARVASIQAGLSMDSVAMAVNRLCSSGLQAIVTTRGLYGSPAMRTGARMGDTKLIDMMVSALTDPFGVGHMGITAENLAKKWNISREEQDAFAALSHQKAAKAIAEGRFKTQIAPITIKTRKGEVVFDTDEGVKAETTAESLSKLKPVFLKENGTVTAGNASSINDGASFFVLASAQAAERSGHKPLARLVSYAVAGVPNEVMGEGPIPASKLALSRAGLTVAHMDVVESNEAFAVQSLTVAKALALDLSKTNVNGGAIALGHPIGASGAAIATKAIYELHRSQGKYALVTMCIGGGQGIAVIFERL